MGLRTVGRPKTMTRNVNQRVLSEQNSRHQNPSSRGGSQANYEQWGFAPSVQQQKNLQAYKQRHARLTESLMSRPQTNQKGNDHFIHRGSTVKGSIEIDNKVMSLGVIKGAAMRTLV